MNVRFPDGSLERRIGLWVPPDQDVELELRDARWRIIDKQLPELEERGDVMYEVIVEPIDE